MKFVYFIIVIFTIAINSCCKTPITPNYVVYDQNGNYISGDTNTYGKVINIKSDNPNIYLAQLTRGLVLKNNCKDEFQVKTFPNPLKDEDSLLLFLESKNSKIIECDISYPSGIATYSFLPSKSIKTRLELGLIVNGKPEKISGDVLITIVTEDTCAYQCNWYIKRI